MESHIIFIFVFISAAIFLIAISISLYLLLNEKKLPETYDCYIFSIFWTPSSCGTKYSKKNECYQRIKQLGIEKYFTIHGLWPSALKGLNNSICNEGMENEIVPNFDSDKSYKNKLEHYWPGLYSNNTYLWKHEYNKHGYCYIKRHYLNFVDDYKKYFDKSIELFETGYRDLMEKMLPDSFGLYNVSKKKFKTLVKTKLNLADDKTFSLICNDNLNLLTEIYFIYDLNYKRTAQEKNQESCPDFFFVNFTDENKEPFWDKYDYYILAVQYSPNICVFKGQTCLDILKKKEYYKAGIHGLWPSHSSGYIPQDCNIGEDIEIKVNESQDYFENYILKYWFSLYNTDDYFLTHEYNRHGYCYNKRIGENETNYKLYLNKTLEVYHKFNFSRIFDDLVNELGKGEHCLKKNELIEKIEKKCKKNSFGLKCFNFKDKIYLEEIYFKFDQTFNLIDNITSNDDCITEDICLSVI